MRLALGSGCEERLLHDLGDGPGDFATPERLDTEIRPKPFDSESNSRRRFLEGNTISDVAAEKD